MLRIFHIFCTFLLSLVNFSNPAQAAASAWISHPEASLRLITDHDQMPAGAKARAALEIVLTPGWKTYWRSPGLSGAGPEIQWSPAMTDMAANQPGPLRFPWPEVFLSAGAPTIGYTSSVVLPFTITAPETGSDVHMSGEVFYQVCQDICVPLQASVSLTVPIGTAQPAPEKTAIDAAWAAVPRVARQTLFDSRAWIDQHQVMLQLIFPQPFPEMTSALLEGPYGLSAPSGHIAFSEDRRGARIIFDFGSRSQRLSNQPAQVSLSAGLKRYEFPVKVLSKP